MEEQLNKQTSITNIDDVLLPDVPTWYTSTEMKHYLIRHKYSEEIANELANRWADDLQSAFEKGYEKAFNLNTKNNVSALLTIWVVRNSAFSIQCGGLERLFIHFTKPIYVFTKPMTSKQRDTPFGDILESEGLYAKYGWIEPSKKTWVQSVSVGNWIGYENEVSEYIWEKLKEHFHYEPFENWHIVEKEGRSNVEDFLLEMQLSISLN